MFQGSRIKKKAADAIKATKRYRIIRENFFIELSGVDSGSHFVSSVKRIPVSRSESEGIILKTVLDLFEGLYG